LNPLEAGGMMHLTFADKNLVLGTRPASWA
jgi:hypothetical protein